MGIWNTNENSTMQCDCCEPKWTFSFFRTQTKHLPEKPVFSEELVPLIFMSSMKLETITSSLKGGTRYKRNKSQDGKKKEKLIAPFYKLVEDVLHIEMKRSAHTKLQYSLSLLFSVLFYVNFDIYACRGVTSNQATSEGLWNSLWVAFKLKY